MTPLHSTIYYICSLLKYYIIREIYMRRRKGSTFGTILSIIFGIYIVTRFMPLMLAVLLPIICMLGGIAILTSVLKKHGFTEINKDNKPTKNPYSVNYDRQAAERADEERRRRYEQQNKPVVDTTYREVKDSAPTLNTPTPEPKVQPTRHKKTGDAEIDKMVEEMDKSIDEMKRLDEAIEDEKISEQIVHLETVTERIVEYLIKHPKKKKQMGKFFDYYLPTTIKLLNSYKYMDEAGISGVNIDSTKEKVENMMDMALGAFDKQLDALYADEALDVSTDITVMQNMLKSEGLTEDDITLTL